MSKQNQTNKNNNIDETNKELNNESSNLNLNKKDDKTIRKKVIKIVAVMVTVLYIIYAIYLLIKQPTNIFTVENGKLYQEETSVGYIIREEKVIKGENYKNGMEQIKAEGERASVNEDVFRYYSANEENLKQKIVELDIKIQDIMKNDISPFSSDMKMLESQIDEKIQDIGNITDVNKLNDYKKEIDSLVAKKARIAGDSSPKGSKLNQLIEERKNYESQLNSGAEYVKTPISGIVSYRVDGLEDVLTPESFSSINKEYLENLNLKTGKIVATSEESGKVINNFVCYIATIVSSEEAKNAEVGNRIKVRLSNNKEISATIAEIKEEENDRLIILKITEQISELINYRKITLDVIWWSATGLKVPNQAIVEKDGLNYVVRNRTGYLSKILVNVKKQGEKYSIVEPYENDKLKELGYTSEEIFKYKKISLYDEILINPNLEQVE